jgi:rubrerythrin
MPILAEGEGKSLAMREVESALAVIRIAVHNEITGQRFYSDAAYFCIDPWAKEVFANLAGEEEVHLRLLLLEYQALSDEGRWLDPQLALASDAEVEIARLTFPDGEPGEELFPAQESADQVVDRRTNDLDALAFGIEMEQRAIQLYRRYGREAEEPAAGKAYHFLVEEETRHYNQLKAEWERLAGTAFEG